MPETGAWSLAELLDEREHLLEIARWLFGSADTADWIVRETYRRWYALDEDTRAGILLPKAWLARAVAEISLELLDPDRTPAPIAVPLPVFVPQQTGTVATHDRIARRFAAACGTGDIADLTAIMATDAVVVCDSGGKVRVPVRPIRGADEVARFVAALLSCGADDVLTVEPVNGRTGLALRRAGRAVAVVSVSLADTEVTAVWIVLNPDKLHGWHRR